MQQHPLTRAEELSLLAMLHVEHPNADRILVEPVQDGLWAVAVHEDDGTPERYFISDW